MKVLIGLILLTCLFLFGGCYSDENIYPEIQERNYVENSKTDGKVTFKKIGYKGVYQVNIREEISETEIEHFVNEIVNKFNVKLVKPSHKELSNPNLKNKIFWIENVSDEVILEVSKDDKIKFITQYYTSH